VLVVYIFVACSTLAVAYFIFSDPEIMVCDLRTCRVLRFGVNGDNCINTLNHELNPICYLLALLGDHHFLNVSRIRLKLLTFRLLMS